jgi:hypothetical protein
VCGVLGCELGAKCSVLGSQCLELIWCFSVPWAYQIIILVLCNLLDWGFDF